MENADIGQVLDEFGDLLELTGGNPFRARAYHQAAQVIDRLPVPLSERWRKGELSELPRVGTNIAEHVGELLWLARRRRRSHPISKPDHGGIRHARAPTPQ